MRSQIYARRSSDETIQGAIRSTSDFQYKPAFMLISLNFNFNFSFPIESLLKRPEIKHT